MGKNNGNGSGSAATQLTLHLVLQGKGGIDDAVPIKVNQDGAVVLSLLPCPVADAQMTNRFSGRDLTTRNRSDLGNRWPSASFANSVLLITRVTTFP